MYVSALHLTFQNNIQTVIGLLFVSSENRLTFLIQFIYNCSENTVTTKDGKWSSRRHGLKSQANSDPAGIKNETQIWDCLKKWRIQKFQFKNFAVLHWNAENKWEGLKPMIGDVFQKMRERRKVLCLHINHRKRRSDVEILSLMNKKTRALRNKKREYC